MQDIIDMFKYMIVKILQYILVCYYTLINHIKSWNVTQTSEHVIIEKPYQGQKILLIALYQKGTLRPDIKRFLILAKQAGLYVIGVNTASLTENVEALFDVYIERPNMGRDFGSYKSGFEYFYVKGFERQCPRLWMVNDSVFYESSRLPAFIEIMINTPMEVLGATENFEVNHHIGSFCISINTTVLQRAGFRQFWAHYRNSDIRLVVIEKGESALSTVLRQCVSNQQQWGAYYDMRFVDKALQHNKENIAKAVQLARRSFYPAWPNLDSGSSCLHGHILDVFRRGSQIHQNSAFLMYMGLPLVKLDGIYRGMYSKDDVAILGSLMSPNEAEELSSLLFSKPFWGDKVKDWRKWLYLLGIQ